MSDSHRNAREPEVFADLPETDPAREVIAAILELVPVSHWSFARFKGDGDSDQLFSSTGNGGDFRHLKSLYKIQRQGSVGPRITATSDEREPRASEETLLFADSRANFGILTLLRTAELGPFASSELQALTLALGAASEWLSTLRLFESHDGPHLAEFHLDHEPAQPVLPDERADSALYVLDLDLSIVLTWSEQSERRVALMPLQARLENRLPAILEKTVRTLTASWADAASRKPGVSRPVPLLVVRTYPLSGPAGLFIGVSIARSRSGSSLGVAAAHFSISPREIQVLALLLDGAQLEDVAKRLHIATSTVQDHIKSLLRKTQSRNRSELIAKVLRAPNRQH